MDGDGKVIPIEWGPTGRTINRDAKQFLRDLQANPFLCIVAYASEANAHGNPRVVVFEKDIDSETIAMMREVLEARIAEGTADANS